MNEANVANAAAVTGTVIAGLLLIAAVRVRVRAIRILFGGLMVTVLVVAGIGFWYGHRPLPPETHETLFQGIEYVRDLRDTPRPLVIHVVRIDLDAPDVRFFVTPGGEDIPARTVSQFLDEFDLQLAINGDYFLPWRDNFPWDYYPHAGDPVNTQGFAASEGTVFTNGYAPSYDTLYISVENEVTFDTVVGDAFNAVSGYGFLVLEGESLIPRGDPSYVGGLHPRTAVGLDVAENTLILLLVDGRQPGYSEGVTLAELSDLLIEYGADHGINLDGGGSATLVVEREDGTPQVLNSPIHGRVPGRERPVANHLGIYARR